MLPAAEATEMSPPAPPASVASPPFELPPEASMPAWVKVMAPFSVLTDTSPAAPPIP